MLRIRLSRVGKKKQPSYRIVVADSRSPRGGANLQIIGHYNPLTDPPSITLKEEDAVRWLQHGAQPSETAAKLLTRAGVMEKAGKQPFVHVAKQVPPKKAKAEAPAPAPTAAAPAPAAPAAAAAPEPAAEAPAEAAAEAEEQAPEEAVAEEAAPADAVAEEAAPEEAPAEAPAIETES